MAVDAGGTGASVERFSNPPIAEAALAFALRAAGEELAQPVDFALLEKVWEYLSADYPRKQYLLRNGGLAAELPDDDSAVGVAGSSADGLQVVEARRRSFSFHRFAPYGSWETFFPEARRTVECFFAVTGRGDEPVSVSARYVNHLRLPYGRPLHEFLTVYPAWPNRDALFTNVSVLAEVDIEPPPGRQRVILRPLRLRGDEIPADPGFFKMILDNAFAFRFRNAEQAWPHMDEIRAAKNRAFQSQLTTLTKELIRNGS